MCVFLEVCAVFVATSSYVSTMIVVSAVYGVDVGCLGF